MAVKRLFRWILTVWRFTFSDIRNILVTTGIGTSVERPFQRNTSRPEIRRAGGDVTNPTTRPPGSPAGKCSAPHVLKKTAVPPAFGRQGCVEHVTGDMQEPAVAASELTGSERQANVSPRGAVPVQVYINALRRSTTPLTKAFTQSISITNAAIAAINRHATRQSPVWKRWSWRRSLIGHRS